MAAKKSQIYTPPNTAEVSESEVFIDNEMTITPTGNSAVDDQAPSWLKWAIKLVLTLIGIIFFGVLVHIFKDHADQTRREELQRFLQKLLQNIMVDDFLTTADRDFVWKLVRSEEFERVCHMSREIWEQIGDLKCKIARIKSNCLFKMPQEDLDNYLQMEYFLNIYNGFLTKIKDGESWLAELESQEKYWDERRDWLENLTPKLFGS